nr:MAG TPA: protein of unknown function (DUF4268) [Caudoviricetes sp.]
MTTQITEEVFKTKAAFEEAVSQADIGDIIRTMSDFAGNAKGKDAVQIVELTQNHELFFDVIEKLPSLKPTKPALIYWIVANHKERYNALISAINTSKNVKIFLFKAYLNENKMAFECILKPELIKRSERNDNTPTKLLQKEYWEKYNEICDNLQSVMQIIPAPKHFQYIPMRKAGVSILQTINTKDKYVATELLINNNKEIFKKLYENKEEIEKELGELDWQSLETNKSSKIRMKFDIDITNRALWDTAVKVHIKLAEELKATFSKYL